MHELYLNYATTLFCKNLLYPMITQETPTKLTDIPNDTPN